MGGYEFDLEASEIPEGTTEIEVMYNGESIRTIMVQGEGSDDSDSSADYLESAPATIYEDTVLSPQNMYVYNFLSFFPYKRGEKKRMRGIRYQTMLSFGFSPQLLLHSFLTLWFFLAWFGFTVVTLMQPTICLWPMLVGTMTN
jgi:hypothetical protein